MKRREGFILFIAVAATAGCMSSESAAPERVATTTSSLTLDERINLCAKDPRVRTGLVTNETCVGADLFLRETFAGNGRSCATCHPVARNFTIDPAFIA